MIHSMTGYGRGEAANSDVTVVVELKSVNNRFRDLQLRAPREYMVLEPRMNVFRGSMQPIGTPGVRSTLTEDLYLSVMNIDPEAGIVGLRAFVNPLVYWIWIGMFVITAGSLIAAWPSRQRAAAPAAAREAA